MLDGLHEEAQQAVRKPVANIRQEAQPPGCDLGRVRSTFAQLAEGLHALHSEAKLHRDIKPSNVLVKETGDVVLLDFGLVAQMEQTEQAESADGISEGEAAAAEAAGIYQTMEQSVSGTAAYMAPEQAIRRPLSEASDWYAVGTMLFEALTGRLPFEGGVMDLLRMKVSEHAPDPSDFVSHVPEDLRLLCLDLLARNPNNRPLGREIVERLTGAATADDTDLPDGIPFVGREPQLNAMRERLRNAIAGHTVVVEVQGLSAMGKSTLVEHFLDEVQRTFGAVVLRGQCYEQESVPYKGIDALVDELARHLMRLPEENLQSALVEDAAVDFRGSVTPQISTLCSWSRFDFVLSLRKTFANWWIWCCRTASHSRRLRSIRSSTSPMAARTSFRNRSAGCGIGTGTEFIRKHHRRARCGPLGKSPRVAGLRTETVSALASARR